MAVLPTDYTDSTTPTGATTEYPATTARGLNATHTQINTNTATVEAATAAATASVLMARDANVNVAADNFLAGATVFAQAGGTTTLTVDSTYIQALTGSSGQTVKLPTTGVGVGHAHLIINAGTGNVVLQSSDASGLGTLQPQQGFLAVANQATPTTSGHWIAYALSQQLTRQTASGLSVAQRDTNANLVALGFLPSITSTATAGTTTALTVTSAQIQRFTGSTTQTITLPTTSIAAGQSYLFINESTGALTVNASGGTLVATIAAGTFLQVTATQATPTTNAHWFKGVEVDTISGVQTLTNKTIDLASNTFTGTTAQFNTALSDGDFATLAGAQALTNKTIDGNSNTLTIRAADIPSGITNGNTSAQSQVVVSATSYYIAGSNLNLPATLKTGMAVGTRFRWTVALAKTAAGTGAFAIEIRRGTAGTVADTADVSQTIGTQSAAVDNMVVDVEIVVTTTGATGAYYWTIIPTNKAITATGFGVATGPTGQFSGTVSSVAMNTASLIFGLSFKATTGTPTITVPMVRSQALNIS